MRAAIFNSVIFFFTLTGFVSAQNQPPVAVNDIFTVVSQVPTLLDVIKNDYDPDGDGIAVYSVIDVTQGTAEIVDGKITYKSKGFIGIARLRYKLIDDAQDSLYSFFATVDINVLPNPDMPVAVSDTFELMQMVTVQLDILANDYDPNTDLIKIKRISGHDNCSVTLSSDSLSVMVKPGFEEDAYFSYYIEESGTPEQLESTRCEVFIFTTVNPELPVAMPETVLATGGVFIDIPVMDNDFDLQEDIIEIRGADYGQHGTTEVIGNVIRYTSEYSFSGEDEFIYSIWESEDHTMYSDYALVTVNVAKNPECPVSITDTAYGMLMTPMTIDVMVNDYDQENEAFEIMDVTGTGAEITSDNMILYTSSALTNSPYTFRYRIREVTDTLSFSEYVEVKVFLDSNPDLPVSVPDYVTTYAGIPARIAPLENDILNSSDTLILIENHYSSVKGVRNDSSNYVIYLPAYQAEGIDTLYYLGRNEQGILIVRGKIYVEILSHNFFDYLDINNIHATVNANGYLFNDLLEIPGEGLLLDNKMKPHFRFPADSTQSSIFSSNIWIGGFDQSNILHMAGERYKQQGIDFLAGPVSNTYDTQHFLIYGRVWKLSASEIEYHRQNYSNAGYQPSETIASWPGNGDVALGQASLLAPFADNNNDGIYRWQDGDFPLIRGDQTIFFMFNDDIQHTETGGQRMKVEIHGMVYGYNNPNDTAIYNTVLVHYDVINRSLNTYHDTYFSIFTDIDLGCAFDDLLGCDVSRGSFYAYNGTDNDCEGEHGTYGTHIPAQSVTILAGPFMDSDGLDNPQGLCDESINGLNFGNQVADDERFGMSAFSYFNNTDVAGIYMEDPSSAVEYYNYMTGYWLDGSHFLYGGNGHVSTGAVGPDCKFMFPGATDPLNWGTACNFPAGGYNQNNKFWTEEETGNVPGDRRGLGIMGPFTFEPGEVQEIEIAYCTGYDPQGPLSSLNQLLINIDTIIYNVSAGKIIKPNDMLGYEQEMFLDKMILYPNPASTFITLSGVNSKTRINYSIYNVMGIKVSEGIILPTNRELITVANLPKGVYIIQLQTGKSKKAIKFIKY